MRAKLRASTKQHLLRAMALRLFGDKRGGEPRANAHNRFQKKGVIPRFSAVYRDEGPGHAIGQPDFLVADIKRDAGVRRVRCIHAQTHRLRMLAPSDLQCVGAIVGEMHVLARHRLQAVLRMDSSALGEVP